MEYERINLGNLYIQLLKATKNRPYLSSNIESLLTTTTAIRSIIVHGIGRMNYTEI